MEFDHPQTTQQVSLIDFTGQRCYALNKTLNSRPRFILLSLPTIKKKSLQTLRRLSSQFRGASWCFTNKVKHNQQQHLNIRMRTKCE